MGTEALWIPAAIAAVGAGASYYNTEQTADKQDKAAAAAINASAEKQRRADQVVDQLITQQTASTPQDEIAAATDDYVSQLQRGKALDTMRTRPGGATFQADQAAVSQGLDAYGNRIADLFARVQAPTLQRRSDAALFDSANQDLGLIKRGIAGDQFINNLKIKSITRNPLLDAFSSAAAGAAASDTDWGNLGSWGGV